jgi:hypothetical protein
MYECEQSDARHLILMALTLALAIATFRCR